MSSCCSECDSVYDERLVIAWDSKLVLLLC